MGSRRSIPDDILPLGPGASCLQVKTRLRNSQQLGETDGHSAQQGREGASQSGHAVATRVPGNVGLRDSVKATDRDSDSRRFKRTLNPLG